MPGELNNAFTNPDALTWLAAPCPGSQRVRLIIRNASVMYQLGYGGRGAGVTYDEREAKFLPPGTYALDESHKPFDAIRARSATVGQAASVTIDCVTIS
jgi:hypothetical protein